MPYYVNASSGNSGARVRYSNAPAAGGDTVSNTTTETAFASTYTLPADTLAVGDEIEVLLWGLVSATIGQTVTARFKWAGTEVLNTGSLSGIANGTDYPWNARISILVDSIGASGKADMQAKMSFSTAATVALAVNVANDDLITINTTQDNILSTTIQWGAASASNIVELRHMTVKH